MMKLSICEMTKQNALTILDWRYDKPYDFYNNENSEEALLELLDGSYYTLTTKEQTLIGFFCIGAKTGC